MSIQNAADERGIREAGQVVADVIRQVRDAVAPGRTTADLDQIAAVVLQSHGAVPAPRLVYGFPGAICLSVNEEAIHGIPGRRVLREGDLVKIDVTAGKEGYIADAAVTVSVGISSRRAHRLASCAEAAFEKALAAVRPGWPVWRIGAAVEREVRRWGYHVVRELYGHGVGRRIHEPPNVPNWADPNCRDRLEEGMVLTVEPIISERGSGVSLLPDQWTVVTDDGSLAAHHEHTLIVTRGRPILVTAPARVA